MSDRKIFLTSFAFISLIILAAAFIVSREAKLFEEEPEPIFISYVGLWDPEVINPLKVEFQRQNPDVTIEYEQKDPKLYFDTLKNLLAKGSAPDIFWWHSGWGPMLKNDLASIPADIVSTEEYEQTYYPATELDAKIGGSYRGIPLEIDGLALIYNKKLFADKKLKKPPETWSELERVYVPALNKYDRKQGLVRSAIALGTENNITNYPEILGMIFFQNDVVFVKDGNLDLNDEVSLAGANLGQKALEFYTGFSPKIWNRAQPNSIRAFTKEDVAMIILPSSKIPTLQSQIKATGDKVKFGVAAVPQPPNATPVTWASYWLSGVSVKSSHQREAWRFVEFLGKPESLRKIFEKEKEIRKIGRPYPRIDMEVELRKDALLAPYAAQAKFAKSWYLHSGTYDSALNDEMIKSLSTYVKRMVDGKGSTKNNLKKFALEAKDIAAKYGVLGSDVPER